MLSNTAHDVNGALQVISGSAELLAARDLDASVRGRVQTIHREAARAASAISQLLSYSRSTVSSPRVLDFRTIVDEAIAMRAASIRHRRISLAIERADDEPYRVLLEHDRALQLLLDLLLAAEDAIVELEKPYLRVRMARTAESVVVTVAGGEVAPNAPSQPATVAPFASAVTTGAAIWTAARLARSQRATLQAIAQATRLDFVLEVPSTRPA